MRSHLILFGSVSVAHLTAAGVTWSAGVPLASPVVLALAGVVSAVLAVTGPAPPADRSRPRRARADRNRLGRLQATGRTAS